MFSWWIDKWVAWSFKCELSVGDIHAKREMQLVINVSGHVRNQWINCNIDVANVVLDEFGLEADSSLISQDDANHEWTYTATSTSWSSISIIVLFLSEPKEYLSILHIASLLT